MKVCCWRRGCGFGLLVSVMATITGTSHAQQVSLPAINLGETSFLDGVARPGWLLQETVNYYTADSFKDAGGDEVAAPQELDVLASITQIAFLSEHKVFGANIGAEVLVPVVRTDLDLAPGLNTDDWGLGDIIVGPVILQWSDSTLFGRPYHHRLNLNFTLPTGEYGNRALVNAGSNTISFNPHYAFTWIPSERWEFSGRFHYLWVSENDNPPAGLGVDTTQAGQALHMNASVSRAISDSVRVGLSGYTLRQISDDRIDGRRVSGSREQVLGIGPAIRMQLGRSAIFANGYVETAARDRPEGRRFFLRWQMPF